MKKLLLALLILSGCAPAAKYVSPPFSPIEFRSSASTQMVIKTKPHPTLTFYHEDGWKTELYCEKGIVTENWFDFFTKCKNEDFSIERIPPTPHE